jgi:hypothetical protein
MDVVCISERRKSESDWSVTLVVDGVEKYIGIKTDAEQIEFCRVERNKL